jgi:hypothetical protein
MLRGQNDAGRRWDGDAAGDECELECRSAALTRAEKRR